MRELIRGEHIANAVRMKRTHYPNSAFLIVEGEDDRAFFARHCDLTACRVQVAYGKDRVQAAILSLDASGFAGALGIVDADFQRLEGLAPHSSNLVWTDFHDIEVMLLSSPALGHLLNELAEPELVAAFCGRSTVADRLLEVAEEIGLIRWASRMNVWSLKFDGIDFDRFVDERTLQIDASALFDALRGHQGGRSSPPPTREAIESAVSDLRSKRPDRREVCRGHDLVAVLAIGLRRVLGRRNPSEVKPERLELQLRLAYESAYFNSTAVFAAMRDWETQNTPYRVLS